MKKLLAVLLTAVLAVSLCACSDSEDDEDYTIDESQTEITDEIDLPKVDVDTELKKKIEEKIDVSQFGPLTTYALEQLEGKNLQLEFTAQNADDKDDEDSKEESSKESSEDEKKNEESSKGSSSSFDFSKLSGDIDVILTKNADDDMRINFGMGLFSFDILKNKDGIFSMNTRKKTYQVLQTAEEVKKMESEASSDSSGQASRIVKSIKDAAGDMFDEYDFDADDILNTNVKTDIKAKDSGTAEYKYKDYLFESYTFTSTAEVTKKEKSEKDSKSESTEVSKAEKTETKTSTADVTFYFDDDKLLKLIHVESDDAKYDIVINALSNEIDPEELVIPDKYEQKETSKISLKDLSGLEDLGLTTSN